jgi:hypothetical protein
MDVVFEQAVIKVEREQEFSALRAAIANVFSAPRVERFLKRLHGKRVRVRDWDGVLRERAIEKTEGSLKQAGTTAAGLYQALTVSDQGQIREFYLSEVERVAPELRRKFNRLFQYY